MSRRQETVADTLSRHGLSGSIVRNPPFEGRGEVNEFGQVIAPLGHFVTRIMDEDMHPELTPEQALAVMCVTTDPYDRSYEESRPEWSFPQMTTNNPNKFCISDLRRFYMIHYEQEALTNLEAEANRLWPIVEQSIQGMINDTAKDCTIEELQAKIHEIKASDQYVSALSILNAKGKITYDDVWGLAEDDPKMQEYRLQQNPDNRAFEQMNELEEKRAALERQVQSIEDFGVVVRLDDFVRRLWGDLNEYQMSPGSQWDARGAFTSALRNMIEVELVRNVDDFAGDTRVADVALVRRDVRALENYFKIAVENLAWRYAQKCWEYIEPVGRVPRVEDLSIVKGNEK